MFGNDLYKCAACGKVKLVKPDDRRTYAAGFFVNAVNPKAILPLVQSYFCTKKCLAEYANDPDTMEVVE